MPISATLHRLARYALVGVTTNLVGYLVYLAVTALGAGPKIAMTMLFVLGTALSYYGNRTYTFRQNGPVGREALKFGAVYASGWLLNYAILVLFVDRLGYPHQLIQLGAIFFVAAYLFACFRTFVFTR